MPLAQLEKRVETLHHLYGDPHLRAIPGAGCMKGPRVMFVFMNPTGRNISAHAHWKGLRAPWLGTKNVWKLFYELRLLSKNRYNQTQVLELDQWSARFAKEIYGELTGKGAYVTNLAKCTQVDARALKIKIFRDYLDVMLQEISLINPKSIVTFGNQVSSILLRKPVSVSKYKSAEKEVLVIDGKSYDVYPTYYPVGQGRRNMPLAIKRIAAII